jgi:TPP-dependent pyruvate/acetoin dehydrogenase alpha subunit
MRLHNYLTDPSQQPRPLDLSQSLLFIDRTEVLKKDLSMMYLIRRVEEIIGENLINGNIKCPCHLGIGQEATAVGLSRYLKKSDRIFGGHRSHTHYLATGASHYQLFAEVLGKADGCSNGMGGSMHLHSEEHGFGGSVPIVGASVPIAVGAALAAKLDGGDDIAVSYLGDSACEEGAVQEAFNLASKMRLPVIFVVENNLFASHMHIDLRQTSNSTARFAQAHGIEFDVIDGNDMSEVYKASKRAVDTCRKGDGPYFIESVTYRWRGHVGPSEDIDVGVKRQESLELWKMRDPIQRLEDALIVEGLLKASDIRKMKNDIDIELNESWERAMLADFPREELLYNTVYSK